MATPIVQTPLRAAMLRGRAWAASAKAIDPTSSDDQFFHIKNNSDNIWAASGCYFHTTVTGAVDFLRVSGASSSPTAIVPSNLGGNGSVPSGLFESGVDLQLTAEAGSGLLSLALIAGAGDFFPLDFLIQPGRQVALNWVPATGILTFTLVFYELPRDEDPR